MSLFSHSNVTCPNCEAVVNMDAVGSVNADRRPDLRDAIVDDTFQMVTCPACGESFRLAPLFTYLDVEHGQWIAGLPVNRLVDWPAAEDEAKAAFDASYGPTVPASARAIADALDVRLCFGWPGIREKIILKEAQLDDVVVEMMKLDLMRRLPSAPFGTGVELRVVQVDGPALRMAWIDPESEEATDHFAVRRALYDDIAGKADAWAALRAQIADGPFVDMQKLFTGAGRGAPADAAAAPA